MANTTFVNQATPILASWLNEVNDFIWEELISAKRYGAVGDGVTDDTAAIQAGLTALSGTNKYLYLTNGTYRVTSALTVPTRTGLIGDGSAILYADSSGFTNADPDTYGTSTSTVLNLSGLTSTPYTPSYNQKIQGLKIRYNFLQGRVCNAITARNCYNLTIANNEIYDFPLSRVIIVASILGASKIEGNYIHDITSNTVFSGYGYPERGFVNITGIDVGDDEVNGVNSENLLIANNHIENLNHGATAIATYGNQADGIQIQKGNGTRVLNNTIINTSEGIDTFATQGLILGNNIKDCTEFGIKLIHGADRNRIEDNRIVNSGLAGITIVGGLLSEGDVYGNIVCHNIIDSIDPNNLNNGATTGCIKIENQATTSVARDNLFFENVLTPGTYGEYVFINNTSGDVRNRFEKNVITAAGADGTYLVLAANNFTISPSHPSIVIAYPSNTNNITTATWTKFPFDTEEVDSNGDFDTSLNRWICREPGWYKFETQLKIANSDGLLAAFRKNGSATEIAVADNVDTSSSNAQTVFLSRIAYMSVADYMEAWVYHASGANRAVTAGSANAYFQVTKCH
jgi:hypothetical protein